MTTDVLDVADIFTWDGKPDEAELRESPARVHREVVSRLSDDVDQELRGVTKRYAGAYAALVTAHYLITDGSALQRFGTTLLLVGAAVHVLLLRGRVGRLSVELWLNAAHLNTSIDTAEVEIVKADQERSLRERLQAALIAANRELRDIRVLP